jgi:hypothetical protein
MARPRPQARRDVPGPCGAAELDPRRGDLRAQLIGERGSSDGHAAGGSYSCCPVSVILVRGKITDLARDQIE